MSENTKMVPAVCTQCGGSLNVDPSQESAKCPFCGMTFVVEKAINNYNVQHATIEHADNVTIDMKGSVNSVLDFVGKQMSESQEAKKELKKQEQAASNEMMKLFIKVFAGIFVLGVIAMIVMNIIDPSDDEEPVVETAEEVYAEVTYFNENGRLFVDVLNPGENEWEFFDGNGEYKDTSLIDQDYDEEGYHFEAAAEIEFGTGYAIFAEYASEELDPVQYSVFDLNIDNYEIKDVTNAENVDDLSQCSFLY